MLKTIRNMACAIALAVAPGAASAALIVDTGTPAANGSNWSLYRQDDSNLQFLAAKFSLAATTTITGIEGFVGGVGTFHIGLADGDQAPNNTLQDPGYLTKRATSSASDGAWSGIDGVNWTLGAGNWWVYFAVLPNGHVVNSEGGDDTLSGFMRGSAPNPLLDEAFLGGNSNGWAEADYLEIGVRIYDNSGVGPGVPEPATWAMMIMGFGLSGALLRRRARDQITA